MNSPVFLTAEEVAEMLRQKPSWIKKAAQTGKLPFPRKGIRPTRFLRSDVEAWMQRTSA